MKKEVINVKYVIHAKLVSNGVLKEPEVIGAIFNQTRGLLGDELELQELQKNGKVGRIEVKLTHLKTKTKGTIKIPFKFSSILNIIYFYCNIKIFNPFNSLDTCSN